jgi:FkbM family methyltransferase
MGTDRTLNTIYPSNKHRTEEYLKKFDREKTLKHLIKSSSPIIYDIGANNGDSLKEFKHWWPNSEVHCFEPQEECWDELDSYVTDYKDSVYINKFAVSNESSTNNIFYTHKISSGLSGFNKINLKSKDSVYLQQLHLKEPNKVSDYEDSINHIRTVKTIRMDEYIETVENYSSHIDLLKIDTQGFEPQVLDSFGTKLQDVDVIITELMFYDYYERSLSFSDIEKYLLPAKFHLYDISHIAKNPMNGRTDWIDVIYVHERLRKHI